VPPFAVVPFAPAPPAPSPSAPSAATAATGSVRGSRARGSVDRPLRDLGLVAPELRDRLARVVDRMRDEFGHAVQVVESGRSQARQDHLYAQGRSRPGPVVTWTRSSEHTRGRAVDVTIDGGYDDTAAFRLLQRVAREEGLQTLGMRDPGHLQLPGDVGGLGPAAALLDRALLGGAIDPSAGEAPELGAWGARVESLSVRAEATARPVAPVGVAAVAPVAGVAPVAAVAGVAQVAAVATVAVPGMPAPDAVPAVAARPASAPPGRTAVGDRIAEAVARRARASEPPAAAPAPALADAPSPTRTHGTTRAMPGRAATRAACAGPRWRATSRPPARRSTPPRRHPPFPPGPPRPRLRPQPPRTTPHRRPRSAPWRRSASPRCSPPRSAAGRGRCRT
jgi:hypothetical protein